MGRLQRFFLVAGLALIGIYVIAQIHSGVMSRAAIRRFEKVSAETRSGGFDGSLAAASRKVDYKLWSEKRVAAYEQSLLEHFDTPLGVLRVSKLNLEVPVLEGTDDLTLNRGVGHIAGTASPGEEGNLGIAGHRDGFFRVLKDIAPGDAIELVTTGRKDIYKVDKIILVDPSDVSVLQSHPGRQLTLVTCYPFYFVGSAPQRYIVEASLAGSEVFSVAGGRTSEATVAGR
jgi:sortase A